MFKKAGVIAAVILICLLLIPVNVMAQRRIVNRYTLRGEVNFRYERFSSDGRVNDFFRQTYSLNLSGPIWHPRFMVFKSDVSFAQTTRTSYTGSDENLQVRKFSLNTTVFPQSKYPLLLYFRRVTSENFIDQETDSYGLKWTLRFKKKYPRTTLFFDKTDITSGNTKSERFYFGVNMDKKIKATDNSFSYTGNISDDNTTKTETHSVFFDNNTKLTRTAFLNLGGNYMLMDFKSPTWERTATFISGRMRLSLNPNRRLRHSYSYNINLRDSEEEETMAHSFTGSLSYQWSKRLSLREGLTYYRSDTTEGTLRTTTHRLRVNSGVTYRLTPRLSTFGDIRYSDLWWDPVNPVTKESSVKRYELRVGLSYGRPIIRGANFSSSYAVGINTTDSERYGSTTDVLHSFRVGISGMNFRYFTLSSNYGLNINTTDRPDDIRYEKTEHNFGVHIGSREWKFLTLSAGYTYNAIDSRVDELDEDFQTIRVNAQSGYFNRTNITAFYGYDDIKRAGLQRTEVQSFNTSINHFLRVWRGILNLSAGYDTGITSSESGTTKTTTVSYEGRYSARLRRNLSMELTARRDEVHYKATESETNRFRARFFYGLRAWSIDTDYEYRISESDAHTTKEHRLMINATRRFRRIFFR